MIELPALNRLYDLDEISAALVFRDDGKVLGFAAPSNYTEATMNQIATAISQPLKQVDLAKVELKDLRISYEGYSIWIKRFTGRQNLAVFIQHGANFSLLRQPINLAVLNLEKALLRRSQEIPDTLHAMALATVAHHAEMEMLMLSEGQINPPFEKLATLLELFFGPIGTELLSNAIQKEKISLPISNRADMEKLVQFTARLLINVERKKLFMEQAQDLLDRAELDLLEQSRKLVAHY